MPEDCTAHFFAGIDEAGRGPVLGPMIFGCCFWDESQNDTLGKLGFDDSKVLKQSQREELFSIMESRKDIGFAKCTISAEFLSREMLRDPPVSLNAISLAATVNIIKAILDKGIKISNLFVDAVGNTTTYTGLISEELSKYPSFKVIVKNKADSLFPVVSAASIVAKVTRDRCMEESGCNCSGYPSDSTTVQWLKDNFVPFFGFKQPEAKYVRFSWKTVKSMFAEEVELIDEVEQPKMDKFMQNHVKRPILLNRWELVDKST